MGAPSVFVLILVCAKSLSPAACDLNTADSSVRGPRVANEIVCGQYSEFYMGSREGGAVQYDPKTQYLKVVCSHGHRANAAQ
jgi:hypothetical protein